MFAGFVQLGDTFKGGVLARDGSGSPAAPDAPPSFAVYGSTGQMPHGSGTATKLGVSVGLYGFRLVADPADGYEIGGTYLIVAAWAVGGQNFSEVQRFTVT